MRRSKQAGGIMVLSLTVMTGLIAILAVAVASQRVAAQAQYHRMEQRRARIAAEAGIQRALAELQTQVNSPTLQTDAWYTLGTTGEEAFAIGSTSFRLQIVDAASRININTATQAQLELLPLTGEQVDCLLDWRENSRSARSDGAKDEYYNQLTTPYNARLAAFQSVDELLLVKGFTANTLYQVQTDVVNTARPTRTTNGTTQQLPIDELVTVDSISQAVDANSQGKFNINAANNNSVNTIVQRAGVSPQVALAMIANRPAGGYANIGAVLGTPGVTSQSARGILNGLTTGGQAQIGKINLNTATEDVLATIPNLPPDVASAIVSRQSSGFTQLGDLVDIPGMNNITVLQQTAGFFEVNSQYFLIRVLGKAGQSTVALQATVDLNNGQPKIIRIEQPPYADAPTEWGWQPDSTTTTTLKESQ